MLGKAVSAAHDKFRDVGKPVLRWSVPYSHGECWNTREFVRAAVVLADRGQRLPRSSLGVSALFLGRAGRLKPGRFGDSFWRWPWPCAVRTRRLPRRGYCDARRRFVHDQVCDTSRKGRHTGAWRSSILVPPKPSSDVTSWIVCFGSGLFLIRAGGRNAPSSCLSLIHI